ALTNPAHITDVMTQERDDEMQPIARRHAANTDVPAAQDLLPDQRDHDGVIDIVISRIAGRDIFKSKLRDKADDARIARLEHPIGSFVHRPKFANKRFDDDQRWIEHRIVRRIFSRFYRKAYSSFSLYSICFGNTPTPLFLYRRHASRKLKSAARVRSARPRED